MRSSLGLLAVAATLLGALEGCGGTVYRLPGEPITPGGQATNACESADWLVIAPTRAQVTSESKRTSHPENGLGLYRVGSDSPETLTSIEGLDSPSIRQKRESLEPYDRKQLIAGALGGVGLVAIAVGAVLFGTAFGSNRTPDPVTGIPKEEHVINGTKAGVGGALVGIGFGFGIAGLTVNPDQAERTQARATRHVFFDPPDDPKSVETLVSAHNARVHSACAAAPP